MVTPKHDKNFLKIITGAFLAILATFVFSFVISTFVATPAEALNTNINTNTSNTNTTNTNTTKPPQKQPTDKPTNGEDGGFVPCGNTADNPCQVGHLFSAFVVIINYLIAMGGFVAILAIVYAGLMMIYSQGQENLKAAKGRFTGAIFGLVFIGIAFVAINALFAGSLSVGVEDGASILSSPLDYIQKGN